MGIGHLYYYALGFLLCGLYSHSHFEGWPENGWAPHKVTGLFGTWRGSEC